MAFNKALFTVSQIRTLYMVLDNETNSIGPHFLAENDLPETFEEFEKETWTLVREPKIIYTLEELEDADIDFVDALD